MKNKEFANQVAGVIGSGIKGMGRMYTLYQIVLNGLTEDKSEDEILSTLLTDKRFVSVLKPIASPNETNRRDFDTDTKSAIYIRAALDKLVRCQICQGFVDSKSCSIDHIVRREDGGLGRVSNGQITHLYCNTTYKN